jgi:hypothetical protein
MKTTRMKIPNKRRSTDEGHLAALVRRKMISKNHGDKKKYNRKDNSWKGESPSHIYWSSYSIRHGFQQRTNNKQDRS